MLRKLRLRQKKWFSYKKKMCGMPQLKEALTNQILNIARSRTRFFRLFVR